MNRTEWTVGHKVRTLIISISLVAVVFNAGCSTGHYAQGKITIKETIFPIPQPKPEIVVSETFFTNRDGYEKVAIYFMSKSENELAASAKAIAGEAGKKAAGAIASEAEAEAEAIASEFVESEDVLELEKTFIRNGFKVLEVRQLAKIDVEKVTNQSSDFLVFVQNFRDERKLVGSGEIEKNAKFYYGTDPAAINQEKTAEEIDALAGQKMSMSDVVATTKQIIQNSRSTDDIVKKENGIFLEAKIVDVKTREVVLFYKSYTFSDRVKVNSGKKVNTYTPETGKFKYDDKLKKFVAFSSDAVAKARKSSAASSESSYYGNLRKRDSKTGDDLSVTSNDRLRRLATACDKFIGTIKNYQADKYPPRDNQRSIDTSMRPKPIKQAEIYPYKANAYIGSETVPVVVEVLDSTETHYQIKIESTGKIGKLKKDQIRIEKIRGEKQ